MKRKKALSDMLLVWLLTGAALFLMPTATQAQSKKMGKRTKGRVTAKVRTSTLKAPAAPSPVSVKERTIKDLLYFPYGCLPTLPTGIQEAKEQLTDFLGTCESVNLLPGLHAGQAYDFTYRGTPVGCCYGDWTDNRQWYEFYFNTKTEAEQFHDRLVDDIKGIGIPLAYDKIYGGVSNRTRPVSVFRWVYVNPPERVKEADEANINTADVVGMYFVELGVYKKAVK